MHSPAGSPRGHPKARLNFETLISDLSARFVSLPPDQADDHVERALQGVREFFRVDRCGLLRVQQDREFVYVSHASYGPGLVPIPRKVNLAALFPWSYERLVRRGETVFVSRLGELPAGAGRDRQTWTEMGVRSSLSIPIEVGGGVRHIIALNSVHEERTWPKEYVPRLRLLGEVFVNALERRRTELLLAESEERVRLAVESGSMGLWVLDLGTGRYWVTDKTREFFDYAPDEEVTLEGVLRRIHPEDRQQVRQALEDVVRADTEGSVEYRVVSPGGSFRWLTSQGRAREVPDGSGKQVMGVTFDITVRKRGETALHDSAERLAAAADLAGMGYYEAFWDQGRVVVDDRLRELVGLPAEEDTRTLEYWLAHVHPEDRGRVMETRRNLLSRADAPLQVQYRYQHPGRGERWFGHAVRPLDVDAQGQVLRSLGVIRDITEQKRAEEALLQALEEARRLKDDLQRQNVYLSAELKAKAGDDTIVGESEAVLAMISHANRVAPVDSSVLISGETGTGKELLAKRIHETSHRRGKPMVTVNCAALPAPLVESELFGRERGAYTGAMTRQAGRFEAADGSTLFLDEIAELSPDLQAKLLRVLQEGRFERLGSNRCIRVDVRVIAATNRDLATLVSQGAFRADLFYRLNVFPIVVPPLRSRDGDIPLLVWHFVRHYARRMGKNIDAIPREVMAALESHPWPGNVRELRNVVERAVILSDGHTLKVELPVGEPSAPSGSPRLEDVERRHILEVLERTGWRIGGARGAAEQLGLVRTTLNSRLRKLGISRPRR